MALVSFVGDRIGPPVEELDFDGYVPAGNDLRGPAARRRHPLRGRAAGCRVPVA